MLPSDDTSTQDLRKPFTLPDDVDDQGVTDDAQQLDTNADSDEAYQHGLKEAGSMQPPSQSDVVEMDATAEEITGDTEIGPEVTREYGA